ncbi:hypothetical protein [Nonomuraea sp. CA-141351]|uniref:hypothetical protein n=1 Tax=Nonomuraea sp. CA-141351 TaxID=3239996 RepID=UPI003D902B1B
MNPVNVDELAAEKSEAIYESATAGLFKVHYGCGCTGYRVHLDGHPKPSELAKVYGMIPDTHHLDDTDLDTGSVMQHFEHDGQNCPN